MTKSLSDNWDNAVEVYPKMDTKICAACDEEFTPKGFWEKRCDPCRIAGNPRRTEINNPNFTGKRELPKGFRTYSNGRGEEYPSVTTIIHPNGIDYPSELLNQYAARGTIVHKLVEHFLGHNKEWLSLDELKEQYPEMKEHLNTMLNGSLCLEYALCDWQGFYREYSNEFTFDELETKVMSDEHRYAGRIDALGTFLGEPAIIDFKTASQYTEEKLDDYYMQLSAYAKASGANIKYLVVIPLNPKSTFGYEAPKCTEEVDRYFEKFLAKRLLFKTMYGV